MPIYGAVIFVDLDRYLSFVETLYPEAEWELAAPIYELVRDASDQFGITLVRTFGDGFLFCVECRIDKRLLERCVSFVVFLRNGLSTHNGMTFKASLVAGSFMRVERVQADKPREIILTGAIVNLAGKKIAKAERRSLFVSWPLKGRECQPLSFSDLSEPNPDRRVVALDISHAESVAKTWPNPPWTEGRSPTLPQSGGEPDVLKFINDTKMLTHEYIKLADDKAKAVFAVSGGLLVYLFNSVGWPKFSLSVTVDLHEYVTIITLTASSIALGLSMFFSLCVVMPRMRTSFDRGLVFFRSIVVREERVIGCF